MKEAYLDIFEIDDSFERIDFGIVEEWLSGSYWSPGIKKDEIIKGARNSSIVVGCYENGVQVGYLRAVSDRTRFAYFLDIFVDEKRRRRGIARRMIGFVLEHPDFKDVYQWMLSTKDAHEVYSRAGFKPLDNPDAWMMIKKSRKTASD